jgi:hypothetical protein
MIIQLLFALGLTCVTVLIHTFGTWAAIGHLARVWPRMKSNRRLLAAEIQLVRVISVMLLLHLVEAGTWAVFYLMSGDIPDLETAIYFSMTSYTTVGYGDVVLPPPWRILGPIEAAVGILMFGWTTAIIVAAITKIYENRLPRETGGVGQAPPS